MAKAKSLVDDVLGRVRVTRPGFPPWFERLPPDAQSQLEQVREQFNRSIHTKRAFAKAIIEVAKEHGWPVSGIQGVERWLEKRS